MTPVIELGTRVCAIAKRNEGNKLPNNPTEIRNMTLDFGILFNRLIATGSKNMEAERIRSEPTCPADNAINPFLIRINELPHINANMIRRNQAKNVGLSFKYVAIRQELFHQNDQGFRRVFALPH